MIDTDKYEDREALRQYLSSASIDLRMKPHFETYEDLLAEVKRLREQGRKLIEAAERVRSDISDQDTGWYYQLGNHIEKMNRLVSE